jgi:hypothetical protein
MDTLVMVAFLAIVAAATLEVQFRAGLISIPVADRIRRRRRP